MSNSDDESSFIATRGAEAIASTAGSVAAYYIGLALAGPPGAVLGGVTAAVITQVAGEFSKRMLATREDFRVGRSIGFIREEIQRRLDKGDVVRPIGFFQPSTSTKRTDAGEVLEDIFLKCQREVEEKKIKFISNIFVKTVFDENIDVSFAHHMIKMAESLSYEQFCLINLFHNLDGESKLRDNRYNDCDILIDNNELTSALYQIIDLSSKGLVFSSGKVVLTYTNVKPSRVTLLGLGNKIYDLMNLSDLDQNDVLKLQKLLSE